MEKRPADQAQIRHLLRWQGIVAGLSITLAAPFGFAAAMSACVGAGACFAANVLAAFWAFRRYRAQEPGTLLLRFYSAEIAKIAIILALFAVAFATFDSLILPVVLVSYFAVQTLPALLAHRFGSATTANAPDNRL